MNGEKGAAPLPASQAQVERFFEQPPDAISFYCDFAQVLQTESEVVIQFYETIPAPPGRDGLITKVVSRLRATLTFSYRHAHNFGNVLVERTKEAKIESH